MSTLTSERLFNRLYPNTHKHEKQFGHLSSAIRNAETEYRKECAQGNFLFSSSVAAPYGLDKRLMTLLYDYHLVQSSGNTEYERLKNGRNGERLCGYCDIREAETLDHYKEKARYPLLAVAPSNLVPSCAKCNHNLASVDNKYHPYYDPQLPDGWLRARLIWDGSDEPPGIRYYTTRSAIGDKRLRSRVRDTLYGGSIAARWIVEFNQSLRALYRDFYDISNIDERKQIVEDTYSRRLHVYPGPMVATKHAVIASRWLRKWRTA
ncbi:hypothetical protein ACTXKH_12430 [Brachybacterium tyrofermentans]|uniref:hypothetical protein n=1 Tax=Brachybacterium tyrofermentans TaxID=47848 RepID=UPI003F8D9E07